MKRVAEFVDDFRVVAKLPGGFERLDLLYETFRDFGRSPGDPIRLSPGEFAGALEALGFQLERATGDVVLVRGLRLRSRG